MKIATETRIISYDQKRAQGKHLLSFSSSTHKNQLMNASSKNNSAKAIKSSICSLAVFLGLGITSPSFAESNSSLPDRTNSPSQVSDFTQTENKSEILGSLYISIDRIDTVLQYDLEGNFMGILNQHLHRGHGGAIGMGFDTNDRLLLARGYSNSIQRYNSQTNTFETFTKGGSLSLPHQFSLSQSDSDLYVSSWGNGTVQRFDGATGAFKEIVASGLGYAVGIETDATGNLYISSRDRHKVYKYDGTSLSILIDNLLFPECIEYGPDGYIYVSQYDRTNGQNAKANSWGNILRYTPDGKPFGADGNTEDATFIVNDGSAFSSIAFGPDGNLYGLDYLSGQLKRYNSTTGNLIDVLLTIDPLLAQGATGLAFDPSGFSQAKEAPQPVPESASVLALLAVGLVGTKKVKRG